MSSKPFLTQFKTERISNEVLDKVKLQYNSDLDYNMIVNSNQELLGAMTKTEVRLEEPDEPEDDVNLIFLKTNTITEVHPEEADEIESSINLSYIKSQTNTRINKEDIDTLN